MPALTNRRECFVAESLLLPNWLKTQSMASQGWLEVADSQKQDLTTHNYYSCDV
jgi:hypothetical protein